MAPYEMESPRAYSASSSTVTPLLTKPKGTLSFPTTKAFDSFRSGPPRTVARAVEVEGRVFNAEAAAWNTAHTPLVRRLKGRHLQMIAIGGSIGTGLFIGSGSALSTGGPASLLLAFAGLGATLFCVVQALGEMAVMFPVAGSFNAYATRFIDPAWGFACGWNYALQWTFTVPLEIMAAGITFEYWHSPVPAWVIIALFLVLIITINICSVKVYGEAEYTFSIVKVAAVIGFIILGVVINCAGTQDSGYIGGRYWDSPGAFHHGFKGFCNILVIAAFAFAGTELVGLAAAETQNPSKALPTAIKQVFWRIAIFYIISIGVVGLLVPYNDPQLITRNHVDAKASPFIIAIKSAGIQGLDSVMNAVVMIAVLSVANSSMYAATRTLAALAEQGQAPRFMAYVDRKGRPLAAIGMCSCVACLAFLYLTPANGSAFSWLLAFSGLSTLFAWTSICYSHIKFRAAWAEHGNQLSDLVYRSPVGVIGSWVGLTALIGILLAQLWVAIAPLGDTATTPKGRVINFFEAYMSLPVVVCFFGGYKFWFRTKWIHVRDVDLVTGRNEFESEAVRKGWVEDMEEWPRWKVLYKTLC